MSDEKKDQEVETKEEETKKPEEDTSKTNSTENVEEKTDEAKTEEKTDEETKNTEEAENKPEEKEVEDVKEEAKKETEETKEKVYPDAIPGATVKVHEKIREQKGKEVKERIQIFEGIVLARKHGSEPGATITVRKIAKGNFGVEKIYPLHSPVVDKIEVVKQAIVKRSKLGFLRSYKKKLQYKKNK